MGQKVTKHLYQDFLNKKNVYHLNIGFWKKQIQEITTAINTKEIEGWYSGRYANGKLRYDGNPIYSGYIKAKGKAFRIIQEEPELDTVEIGAWVEKKEREEQEIQELTISLELSVESKRLAYRLLRKWLTQDVSTVDFSDYIDEVLKSDEFILKN